MRPKKGLVRRHLSGNDRDAAAQALLRAANGDDEKSMIRRGLSLAMTALLLQVAVIEAASLDKETCDKLKT